MLPKTFSQKGQALILVVAAIVGLVALTALAIDAGNAFSDRRHAQNAADTAALAGALTCAQVIPPLPCNSSPLSDQVTTSALDRARSNGYNNDSIPDTVTVNNPPVAGCNGTNGPYVLNPEYIQVIINSNVDTFFAPIVGIDQLHNCVEAISRVKTGSFGNPASGMGILTLNETAHWAFNRTGSGNVTVENGGIFVNSNADQAFRQVGSGNTISDFIQVVGGAVKGGSGSISPWPPTTGVPPINDPFAASVAPPAKPGGACPSKHITGSGNHTINPGCYSGIRFTGSGKLTMNPGLYWIDSGGFDWSGSGEIIANEVLIYIDANGGEFNMTGSGTLTLSPPTSGPYKGMVLFMDRENTEEVDIAGSGSISSVSGTFYAPASQVELSGSGGYTVMDAQIICDTFKITGSGNIRVRFDEDSVYQTQLPPEIELSK
ncbi:MAG: Tad domain-containing protein [Chloroflexi bacterium]|nr:Tad domain-containing protein [Chloroflexota bacterium]